MRSDDLKRSRSIRGGIEVSPTEGLELAIDLSKSQHFDEARRLAQHLINREKVDPKDRVKIRQQLALWISKNPDAPDDTKHDEALNVLDRIGKTEGGGQLAEAVDPETLGIAGGICKRKWLVTGRLEDLERSLHFYERGAKGETEKDNGYTAINAAFVHDLLSHQKTAFVDDQRRHQENAKSLRKRVLDDLLPIKGEPVWEGGPSRESVRWFNETIAEAYFGLGNFPKATEYLKAAYAIKGSERIAPWEIETTARQFAWLARLQDPDARTPEQFKRSKAWGVLREIYGEEVADAAPSSLFAGKLGLALSGGGFRASLFHIGVLAALAERDLLRHVDVLSCVSGGSIVGAHYYLEVRKLLEDWSDDEIGREDYVELVERLQKDFLAGVQENIRMRLSASLKANYHMAFKSGYTTSRRLGELYQSHLYGRIKDDKKRKLKQLRIKPKDTDAFNPKYDNWKRKNKAPILILNATTVNTGHNWQFTTSWMGEPPTFIDSEIDGNYRLRRMYLKDEAPKPHCNISIGDAVAASSCVPGLFDPLELRDLYQDGVTVRLVDGGVHDNQGVFGLLDQNCSVMIVSDASGQMDAEDDPHDDRMRVLLRTSSILQARVRAAQYREIESRRRSGLLKNLLFLHLKKNLWAEDRDWIACKNPKQLSPKELQEQQAGLTKFGILKHFQRRIAGIRTDLDSFNQTEAFALMTSGYLMTATQVEDEIQGFPNERHDHKWTFLDLEDALRESSNHKLDRLLKVAGAVMFKAWALSDRLRTWTVIALVLAAILLFASVYWSDQPLLSLGGIVAMLGFVGVTFAFFKFGLGPLFRFVKFRKPPH
ncbi:MAG: patatin-like phospholipase family protein, partial [Pseudomonadota bacterium]